MISALFSSAASDVCSLTLRGGLTETIPALFGHNQINGPIYGVPFESAALQDIAKALWSGQLRYPGGTVANYFYWPTATYIEPCKGSAQPLWQDQCEAVPEEGGGSAVSLAQEQCEAAPEEAEAPSSPVCAANEFGVAATAKDGADYDWCKQKAAVDALPKDTFSLGAFNQHVGAASPVTSKRGHVYDLNVLTASPDQIIEQLEVLRADSEANGYPVRAIEFGNELFLNMHYKKWFRDANDYMSKVKPGLLHARGLFPDAKLAVPMGMRFSGGKDGQFGYWNRQLSKYASLFDAVTIHEYTASAKSVDKYPPEHQRSVLAAWGDVALGKVSAWVTQFFGGSKEVWVTEWAYANWAGVPLSHEPGWSQSKMMSSAMTGIFKAGVLLKAVETANRVAEQGADGGAEGGPSLPLITGMSHHLLNDMEGVGWGKDGGLTHITGSADDSGGDLAAHILGPGQIFSHLSYIATAVSDQLAGVAVGSGCPKLDIGTDIEGAQELSCLQASAFADSTRPDKLPIYAVINRCAQPVVAQLDVRRPVPSNTSDPDGRRGSGRLMRTVTYSHEDEGGITPLSKLEGRFEHPWKDGPLKPAVATKPLPDVDEQPWMELELGPITLTIIEELPAAEEDAVAVETKARELNFELLDPDEATNGTAAMGGTGGADNASGSLFGGPCSCMGGRK